LLIFSLELVKVQMTRIQKKYRILLLLAAASIGLTVLVVVLIPVGTDWTHTYRPAALALLHGKSPYTVDIFFAAPWTVIPLIPFALLPEHIGRAAIFTLGLITFSVTAIKLGAKKGTLAAFLFSPPVIHCLYNSNIEWIPILGFILPPQIGLFFVAVKPQIGLGVTLFWLVEAWRKGGARETIRVFGPFTAIILLSFLIFGFWPLRFQQTLAITQEYNASFWPLGIPMGIFLLVKAIRSRKPNAAMAAGPFFSPYVLLHAYSGALVALAPSAIEMAAVSAGLWIAVLLRAFG
jgi:hypothetical protein